MRMAAYCRVSTEEEAQLDSLSNQIEFFENFAKTNGHELVRMYADEGISGKSLKNRDQFVSLMKDAELHKFDMVAVKDISRFARNAVDFLTSIRKLKSMGIPCYFVNSNLSTQDGELVLGMLSLVAQEESALLSKRVKFGKKMNAKKGRVPPRIFGYDRIDNFTLEINAEEAEVVKLIYHLYIEKGMGFRAIILELMDRKIKTKYGVRWYPRAVRRILTDTIYYGLYENNKKETVDYIEGKRGHIPKEEHFFHERPEWAIVTKERFDQAQAILATRIETYKNETTHMTARYSGRHIFSTLVKCGECGRSFGRKSYTYAKTRIFWTCVNHDQYTSRVCDNGVAIDESNLLKVVYDNLEFRLKNREQFKRDLIQKQMNDIETRSENLNIDDLIKQRDKLANKKSKYQEMYANDIISMQELKEKTAEYSDAINKLDKQIDDIKGRLTNSEIEEKAEKYLSTAEDFLRLKDINNADMRRIVKSITIYKDKELDMVLNI